MPNEQFVVVVYDISNDRRRTRLHKRLKDFGSPVQFSVFECLLDSEGVRRMKAVVNQIIRPRLDHVRYYTLCNSCRQKIEVTGRREITSHQDSIIV